MEILSPNLAFAKNAPNSVTVADLKADFKQSPAKKEFWEAVVNGKMFCMAYFGHQNISILDGGCGVGSYTYAMVDEALCRGLDTSVTVVDLVKGNIEETERKISELKAMRPAKVHLQAIEGEINASFPDKKFDLITYIELIHWMKPWDAFELFKKSSDHMHKNARLVVSYCTPLNNASLKDIYDDFDIKRSRGKTPIIKRSYPTGSMMTFYSKENLIDMGKRVGLQAYAFEQLDNFYFPTRSRLHYPFFRDITSTENEIIAFQKL